MRTLYLTLYMNIKLLVANHMNENYRDGRGRERGREREREREREKEK